MEKHEGYYTNICWNKSYRRLRSDGSVVAVGSNSNGKCDVESWEDIVQVAAGEEHTVGLRKDGE